MIRFKVMIRNEVLGEHAFDQPRITIGRTPDNDVVLDNLALSRHHAEVVRTASGWRLRDLDSKNGVSVNGERVQRWNLNDGDLLAVGKFVLAVSVTDVPAPVPGMPGPEELGLQGKTVRLPPEAEIGPAALEREAPTVAWLTVTRGSPAGLFCLQRDCFVVGSAPGCDLRLPGLLSPGRLALVVRGKSGWSLVNVSRKGEGVARNGKPVRTRGWLEDGDRVELLDLVAKFRLGTTEEVPH